MKKLLRFVWKMTQILIILVILPTILVHFLTPDFADLTLGLLLSLWVMGGVITAVVWVIVAIVRGSDDPKSVSQK